jgi:CheY-like chemotaxis protein
MSKLNVLYVDDEVLFIRIVKRIIEHDSEWKDRISFWSACHQFHALSLLDEHPNETFDLVIVDYRLEADKKEDEELNGVKLAKYLKEYTPQCQKSIYALLSATGEKVDKDFFEFDIKKGGGKLEEDFKHMLKRVYYETMYGHDIYEKLRAYSSRDSYKYRGDTEKHNFIRFIIDEKISQRESILILVSSKEEKKNLVADIKNKRFISNENIKIKLLDLSQCMNLSGTLQGISDKEINETICFVNADCLDEKAQNEILNVINEKLHCVFVCSDKKKCNFLLNGSREILLPQNKDGEKDTYVNIVTLDI